MKQLSAISSNAFKVTVGDPFFLVLHLTALILLLLLGAIPGFTYGEHLRLLRDQSQALVFMIGCLGILFGFIRVLTDDIHRGADPILRSRPVSSTTLILGKWAGVLLSVVLLFLSATIAYLWVSEIAYDSEYLDTGSLIFYLSIILISLLVGALRHYLFGGSYVFYSNIILVTLFAACLLAQVLLKGKFYYDWASVQGAATLGIGLITFSAILLPFTILFDSVMVLGIGVALFFLGLISDYLVSILIGAEFLSTICRSLLPNWQLYWVADRLGEGHSIPLEYMGICLSHSLLLVVVYSILTVFLYDRMEISSSA